MNSLPELKIVPGGRAAQHSDRIEDYLDHLCTPLIGALSYPARQRVREEARLHLELLIDDFRQAGLEGDAATEAALREYGDPWQNGEGFLEMVGPATSPTRLTRVTGTATLFAFIILALSSALCLLLLQAYLGLPRMHGLLPWLLALSLALPVAAGVAVGQKAALSGGGALCRAYLVLLPHALVAGLLQLPDPEGLWFAGFQILFWLPVSLFSADAAAILTQRRRCRRFFAERRYA